MLYAVLTPYDFTSLNSFLPLNYFPIFLIRFFEKVYNISLNNERVKPPDLISRGYILWEEEKLAVNCGPTGFLDCFIPYLLVHSTANGA